MKINSNPKILILVNSPDFNLGSLNSAVVNYIKTIASSLEEKGFLVDIWPNQNNQSVKSASPVGNGNSFFKKLKTVFKKNLPSLYYSLILHRTLSFQKKQYSVLKDKEYHLVVEFYIIGSTLGAQLKKANNSKLLMIYDCPVLEQFREMYHSTTLFDKKVEWAEQKTVSDADCVLCYSSSVANYIKEKHNTPTNFFIMPCIVWKKSDLVEKKQSDEVVIGFVGSFLSWHKVPMLLKAFEIIAKDYNQAKLVLVGYGEEWNAVNALREKSIYKDRIVLTGYVSEEELEKLKATFTIGTMPGSNWYGSPLKLFEYAQSKIPMIAPDSQVIKDLFKDKESVLFIDKNNELVSLVKNIKLLIEDKEMAKKIAHNSFNLMNSAYSKEQQMDKFSILVQKLMINGIKE